MKKQYYVYVYLNQLKPGKFVHGYYEFDYEPFYVGKGFGNRYKDHLKEHLLNKNTHKNNTIKKIIKQSMEEPIIIFQKENMTEKQSLTLEKKMIKVIGRDILCNMTDGGEGTNGYKHSKESKKKRSDFMKVNNPMVNKSSVEKMKNTLTGRKLKLFTLEHRRNMSLSFRGKKKPAHSFEHKNKVSNTLSKKPFMIDGVYYKNQKEASVKLKIPLSTINMRLKSTLEKFATYEYC